MTACSMVGVDNNNGNFYFFIPKDFFLVEACMIHNISGLQINIYLE
jgi:hypothetical protein